MRKLHWQCACASHSSTATNATCDTMGDTSKATLSKDKAGKQDKTHTYTSKASHSGTCKQSICIKESVSTKSSSHRLVAALQLATASLRVSHLSRPCGRRNGQLLKSGSCLCLLPKHAVQHLKYPYSPIFTGRKAIIIISVPHYCIEFINSSQMSCSQFISNQAVPN